MNKHPKIFDVHLDKRLKITTGITRKVNHYIELEKEKGQKLFKREIDNCIDRFLDCDWGDLGREDKEANNEELARWDGRIVAKYKTIWDNIYIIGNFVGDETIQCVIMFCDEY